MGGPMSEMGDCCERSDVVPIVSLARRIELMDKAKKLAVQLHEERITSHEWWIMRQFLENLLERE